jgi:hypothetical protein
MLGGWVITKFTRPNVETWRHQNLPTLETEILASPAAGYKRRPLLCSLQVSNLTPIEVLESLGGHLRAQGGSILGSSNECCKISTTAQQSSVTQDSLTTKCCFKARTPDEVRGREEDA